MNAPVPDPALISLPAHIRPNPTPVGLAGDKPIDATTPEMTAAVDRAAKAWSAIPGYPTPHRAKAALAAALDVEEMARSVADDLYGQDVHTLVMRRPGESHRDQADRIGQWVAETVLASVLGTAS